MLHQHNHYATVYFWILAKWYRKIHIQTFRNFIMINLQNVYVTTARTYMYMHAQKWLWTAHNVIWICITTFLTSEISQCYTHMHVQIKACLQNYFMLNLCMWCNTLYYWAYIPHRRVTLLKEPELNITRQTVVVWIFLSSLSYITITSTSVKEMLPEN